MGSDQKEDALAKVHERPMWFTVPFKDLLNSDALTHEQLTRAHRFLTSNLAGCEVQHLHQVGASVYATLTKRMLDQDTAATPVASP